MSLLWLPLFIGGFLTNLDPAWIALIGTLFGGAGLKLLEGWLGRNKERKAQPKDERTELRDAMKGLQDRQDTMQAHIDRLELEVTEWRNRYYSEQEKRHLLRLQLLENNIVPADNITLRVVDETTSPSTEATYDA